MTVPSYKSTGAYNSGAGVCGSVGCNPPFPATVDANDYAIMVVCAKAGTSIAIDSTPSGWTALFEDGSGSTQHIAVFGKLCDGTEDGAAAAITATYTGTSPRIGGKIFTFSDVNTSSQIGANSTWVSASSATASPASLTTGTNDSLAIVAIGKNAQGVTMADSTGESGGDYTAVAAWAGGLTTGVGLQKASMATAGTISGGSISFTGTGNTTLHNCIAFELKGASAATGIPNKAVGGNCAIKRASFF